MPRMYCEEPMKFIKITDDLVHLIKEPEDSIAFGVTFCALWFTLALDPYYSRGLYVDTGVLCSKPLTCLACIARGL